MAEQPADLTVIAINRTMRLALLSDHSTEIVFDTMFDGDGEETLDGHEAISATLEMPNGTWVTLDLRDWMPVTIH